MNDGGTSIWFSSDMRRLLQARRQPACTFVQELPARRATDTCRRSALGARIQRYAVCPFRPFCPNAPPVMRDLIPLLIAHGALLVFLITLAARVGAPLPAAPLLVVAG